MNIPFSAAVNLKAIALSIIILLIPFILLKLERKKNPFKELSLGKPKPLHALISGLGLFGLTFITLIAVNIVLTLLGLADNYRVVDIIQAQDLLTLILAVTIGPIGEELLFRGYLLKRIGLWPQAILFGALHYGYGSYSEIAAALSVGILFGIFVKERKDVQGAVIAHSLYNLFSIIAVFTIAS